MDAVAGLIISAVLLIIGYFAGSALERSHFKSIRKRELLYRKIPVVTFARCPPDWRIEQSNLVSGNVVVSIDYFKAFVGGLRAIVGGRLRGFEPLLDRGRREALLRMIAEARSGGYDAVINVRLQTSRLANARGGEGTAGVEMLAFGTALKLEQRPTRDA